MGFIIKFFFFLKPLFSMLNLAYVDNIKRLHEQLPIDKTKESFLKSLDEAYHGWLPLFQIPLND